MILGKLLSALSEQLGVDFHLDPNGSCAFEYGPGFELTISSVDAGNGVLLHQPIQLLCQAAPDVQLRKCMELNLYGTQTHGAVLGLDPRSGWIVLAQRVAVEGLTVPLLEEMLKRFIDVAERVAAQLGNVTLADENTTEIIGSIRL